MCVHACISDVQCCCDSFKTTRTKLITKPEIIIRKCVFPVWLNIRCLERHKQPQRCYSSIPASSVSRSLLCVRKQKWQQQQTHWRLWCRQFRLPNQVATNSDLYGLCCTKLNTPNMVKSACSCKGKVWCSCDKFCEWTKVQAEAYGISPTVYYTDSQCETGRAVRKRRAGVIEYLDTCTEMGWRDPYIC